MREALATAVTEVHGQNEPAEGQRHVSGQQLCHGLKTLAIQRWGHMAKVVLNRWNIRATIDFGRIVYLMIDNGFMRKNDQDSLEDFRNVYDFEQAFCLCDEFELKE